MQDPKYQFLHELVMNRHTGEIVPADEPVFIFRARDRHAAAALSFYASIVRDEEHRAAIAQRVKDFDAFATEHPERMKEPDTPA